MPPRTPWSLFSDGVDRSSLVLKRTLRVSLTRGARGVLSFSVGEARDGSPGVQPYRFRLDEEVLFYVSGNLWFGGYITDISYSPLHGFGGTKQKITVGDYAAAFERIVVEEEYGTDEQVIMYSSTGSPTEIATMFPHQWQTGRKVVIADHSSTPSLNGTHTITVTGPTTFTVPVAVTVQGGAGTVRSAYTMADILVDLEAKYLEEDFGITFEIDPLIATDVAVLPPQAFGGMSMSDVMNRFTEISSVIWRVLPNKVTEVFLPGTKMAPFSLTAYNANAPVSWSMSRSEYINDVRVAYGGTRVVPDTQHFVGSQGVVVGAWTHFQTTYPAPSEINSLWPNLLIVNDEVRGPVGWGPDQLPGNAPYWDWATHELRVPTWMIAAADRVSVSYMRQYPALALARDPVDVQPPPIGRGPWTARFAAPDITDAAQAQSLAEGILRRAKQPEMRKLSTSTFAGFSRPGDAAALDLPKRAATGIWSVETVEFGLVAREIFYYDYTFSEGLETQKTWVENVKEMTRSGGVTIPGSIGGSTVITGGGSSNPGVGGGPPGGTLRASGAEAIVDWVETDQQVDAKFWRWIASDGRFKLQTLNDAYITVLAEPVIISRAGDMTVTGGVDSSRFSGSGAGLRDVPAEQLTGNVYYARMPAGQGIWQAAPTVAGTLGLNADVQPTIPYNSRLGSIDKKFLTLHAAELWVETLVAQNTIATIGGRVLVARTNTLVADISPTDTTIVLKYNDAVVGDIVYLESSGKVEFMTVTSAPSGSAPNWFASGTLSMMFAPASSSLGVGYQYSVTRNLDGTGTNHWYAGDAVLNTGQIGSGFIDLYSVRGVKAATEAGPTIVGNVRVSTAYNGWEPRWAIGNLRGLYGYSADTYGAAFGDPAKAWLKVDASNGVRIGYGPGAGTIFAHIDATGAASFTGKVTVTGGSNVAMADLSNVTVIDGGKITTGSVTTEKLAVTSRGAALNSDPDTSDLSAWTAHASYGPFAVASIGDGHVGATSLRTVVGAATPYNQIMRSNLIAYDPAKTYVLRAWARRDANANGSLYIGHFYFDAAKNIIAVPWNVANAITPNPAWTAYTGVATAVPAGTKYIAVGAALNYSGTVGYHEIQGLRLEEQAPSVLIADGAVTAAKVVAGAITTTKLDAFAVTAEKIAALAITADKIAAGAVTATKISVTNLSAITSSLGTVNISTGGYLASGATGFSSGVGYWLSHNGGNPQMRIGDPGGPRVEWTGLDLQIFGGGYSLTDDGGLLFETAGGNDPARGIRWEDGATIISRSDLAALHLKGPGAAPSQINLYSGYAAIFGGGALAVHVEQGGLYPSEDYIMDLGRSTQPWRHFYMGGTIYQNGVAGKSQSVGLRGSDGVTNYTLTFAGGVLTGVSV